jgi:beta-lactamase class D
MGTLALAQEVLSEEKNAWMVGWLNNSANRYGRLFVGQVMGEEL